MAKRKLTVTIDGRQAGTRTTDRHYTHAVVLTKFNEAALRRSYADHFNTVAARRSRDREFAHCAVAMLPTYEYAGVVTDAARAEYAADHAAGREAFEAKQLARHNRYLEQAIKSRQQAQEKGEHVLSWHGSLALAQKAWKAAVDTHREFYVIVALVDHAQEAA